jgi:3-hydroxybutyryl-CoA dehydrogenase
MEHRGHIAIIGAGMMGRGIAQIFVIRGHQVSLLDVSDKVLAEAVESIRANLTLLAESGIGSVEDIEPATKRIRIARDLEDAAMDAEFVIEAVYEQLELKQKLFQKLDAICPPDTILTTNTSVISVTEIAARATRKERIVGTHFWNPPYLVPLVEVVKAEETSPQVIDLTVDLLRSVGKHPVKIKRDVPGFVGNRLQHALWREAISIVEQDIADSATVDEVVKKGFGIRLPVLGPLENADMVGLDLTLEIHDYILKYIERSAEPSPLLKQKVEKEELGFKTGRGFKEWTDRDMERCKERFLKHVIFWNREHLED